MGANWDDRYRVSPGPTEPAKLLTSFAYLLPTRGKALDIACGSGRNSIWLARKGLEVTAIDLSAEALHQGRELARHSGSHVVWLQDDVEAFPLGSNEYDVVACFYYRSPALYPKIRRAIRPGGWLYYETYTLDQLDFASGPRNPEHLLHPGELLAAFRDLQVVFYRETSEGRGVASLVARKEQ
ncbi:MAG: class I SAM-dependent methyltransferase [Acidobacteria bacterium]|nr:class I SAM-dependent methyltransferase [Acidobacteriota bacterium]